MGADRDIVLGIDLGTTHSLVAVCDAAGPRILRDERGEGRVPSFLTFAPDGSAKVGWEAKAHAVEMPESTVFSVKRLMGRGYDELYAAGELSHLPYQVRKRNGDSSSASETEAEASGSVRDVVAVQLDGRMMTPPEISAVILRELRRRAVAQLGRDVTKAIITVPAYFDDAQRQATRDAGRIAGLDVLRIINEPTAAALAYGIGVRGQLEGSTGSPGGLQLAGHCPSSQPTSRTGTSIDLLKSAGEGPAVADQPEASARAGSDGQKRQDSIVVVYDLGGGTFDVSILRMARGVFEVLSTHGDTQLGGDDMDREIIRLVQREVAQQFGLAIESPAIRQALRTFAEEVKIRLSNHEQAQIEIDLGADRNYKRTITREEFQTLIAPWVDKTILSCRRAMADAKVEPAMIDQVVMVGGCTRIPLVRKRVEEVFARQPYTALNPDEVVALGAAVQGAVLAGVRHDTLLLDVIPLSLGIETLGGAMSKLILRNSRIPCQATERFSTFVDGQTSVKINVYQGERELVKDCRLLGEVELRGIPPMPAGMPRILVTFLVDENGILNVFAREERSGQQASIQIVPTHGLTRDEVQRMERESYEHAREDMNAHRMIDLRNQVAFDTHKTEQMLARAGEGLSAAERAEIENGIRALRQLAEITQDAEKLHQALETFDRQTLRLAELAITAVLKHKES